MRIRNLPAVAILSSLITVWGQNGATSSASSAQAAPDQAAPRALREQAPASPDAQASLPQAASPYGQRLREMELSLAKMHVLLNDMKAKIAVDAKNSALQKENIELWEIMLGHLDRTLAQARMAAMQRGELPHGPGKVPGSMMYRPPQGAPAAPVQTPPQARPE